MGPMWSPVALSIWVPYRLLARLVVAKPQLAVVISRY